MSEKYTQGPWGIWTDTNGRLRVGPSSNYSVAEMFQTPLEGQEANARRIVACVNACDGIWTDELEEISRTGGMLGPREDVARIAKQRDELLEAL